MAVARVSNVVMAELASASLNIDTAPAPDSNPDNLV